MRGPPAFMPQWTAASLSVADEVSPIQGRPLPSLIYYFCPDPAPISDTHKLSYPTRVHDCRHSGHSNVTPLKLQLVSRDWQQHHQGRN